MTTISRIHTHTCAHQSTTDETTERNRIANIWIKYRWIRNSTISDGDGDCVYAVQRQQPQQTSREFIYKYLLTTRGALQLQSTSITYRNIKWVYRIGRHISVHKQFVTLRTQTQTTFPRADQSVPIHTHSRLLASERARAKNNKNIFFKYVYLTYDLQ